jgi:RNA polymerase sigma-70 factor (ECF subfamily)
LSPTKWTSGYRDDTVGRVRPLPEVGGARGVPRPPEPLAAGDVPVVERLANDAALRHLHQVHGPVLLSFVARLTKGDVRRAEEIVQETVRRAWRHPDARNEKGQWNRAWLFTVAKRIVIDQVRYADVRPVDDIDVHAEPDDAVQQLLDAQDVRAALHCLPERLRITLVEMYFRERSVSEAADALDVPPGTVKFRTVSALRVLCEELVSRNFEFGALPTDDEPEAERRAAGHQAE